MATSTVNFTHKYPIITSQNKTEFIQYLETNGVIEGLTNTLLELYESSDRPAQPFEFIKKHFSDSADSKTNSIEATTEIEKLKNEIKLKEKEIDRLNKLITEKDAEIKTLKGESSGEKNEAETKGQKKDHQANKGEEAGDEAMEKP